MFRIGQKTYWQYCDIPLKVFFDISTNGEIKRIIKWGSFTAKDLKQCEAEWEKIVIENQERNGGYDFINLKDMTEVYANLLIEFNYTKALLTKLIVLNYQAAISYKSEIFVFDHDIIDQLKRMGYKVVIKSASQFWESLNACLKRSNGLVARLVVKQKEMEEMANDKSGKMQVSFDTVMASMTLALRTPISDDITLARFNEYKKLLKERNKPQQQWQN